jgi:hypothetical protein
MMLEKTISCFIALLFSIMVSACASKPIVDTYNVDMGQYAEDLHDCEHVAEQVATGQITAKSAGFGAAVGAAYGVIGGDIGTAAATGAVTGGAVGLHKADDEKAIVTKNCLRHRGYVVLN